MLKMYQCYTPKLTSDQHLRCWRTLCKRSGLTCLKAQINASILSFRKRFETCKKQPLDILNMLSKVIGPITSNCNWTDQLLFAYKIALCTLHSHSFVCVRSIWIKFKHLTAIYLVINWWKTQQNMLLRFLEIEILVFRVLFLCRILYLEFTAWHFAQYIQCWTRPVLTDLENPPVCLLLTFHWQCVRGVFTYSRYTNVHLLIYLLVTMKSWDWRM